VRNAYKILVVKPERKRALRRSKRRWEDIIIMNLREIWLEVVDWMNLAQDRYQGRAVVNTEMKRFHKRRAICWLAERLLASQVLCSMEFVS